MNAFDLLLACLGVDIEHSCDTRKGIPMRHKPVRVIDEDAGPFGTFYWECRHSHLHFFKLAALWCGLWPSKGRRPQKL